MKKQLYPGRFTAENQEDVVVFIIGMRVNNRLAVRKWFPVFSAMPGMIKELYTNKEELGFLSMESYFGLRTTTMIQYWRSMDDLLSYSRGKKHLTAWKKFNKEARNNHAVGFYHETFHVKHGDYESIYVNMPQYGLGSAVKHGPVIPSQDSASERMDAK
ncbi:DUF4188 domain-containing protein [Alkalicoccus daliensis]|uniref:DUF4188 domain-containing protein n=1 Tax=Alkalicoccus daliensis TaxID=745820 RepID=A0A1H0FT96_9BACI|nr:DUF4188 domain-containing protein [Alkalicoccus daliensis]SDN97867.1 protein of unknown function [Alkalicoccus daliensis]